MSSRPEGFHQAARTVVSAIVLVFFVSACGLTAPRFDDGFANLDSPGMADTDRVMSISLGPTMLRFAARFIDDNPEVRALLRSLDGVRVRIYEVHGDMGRITQNFEYMGHKLKNDGWDPVMLMREEGELVQMYAKTSATGICGLTIVSAESDEVVVVNIMGDLEPKYYSDVMMALNVEGAPDVEIATVN